MQLKTNGGLDVAATPSNPCKGYQSRHSCATVSRTLSFFSFFLFLYSCSQRPQFSGKDPAGFNQQKSMFQGCQDHARIMTFPFSRKVLMKSQYLQPFSAKEPKKEGDPEWEMRKVIT